MFDNAAQPQSGLRRLAIVSTYDELCGIGSYTHKLEEHLKRHVDVTVFDLDQYLLRNKHARVQRLADQHIKEIAARLREFDSVNIQLEYGSLGLTSSQIVRRLRRLVTAAPAVCITFHSILATDPLSWAAIGTMLSRLRVFRAIGAVYTYFRNRGMAHSIYAMVRSNQRRKPTSAIAHTRRDMRLLHHVHRIKRVYQHPLSFLDVEQAASFRATANRDQFPILRTLPSGARLIGTFGFLSPYKGFETALRAMHNLPEDYHLLIFGAVHPLTIKRLLPVDPYVKTLLDEAHIGQTILDTIAETGVPLTLNLDTASKDLLARHPQDLHQRVHFMGVHSDDAFLRAMALCDAVVLPYLEVGQSASGPMSVALEMGCRVLASRTLAFEQFAKYHPDQVEFFDIGNHAELADLIRVNTPAPCSDRRLSYTIETNIDTYLQANQPRGAVWRGRPTGAADSSAPALETCPTTTSLPDKTPTETIK